MVLFLHMSRLKKGTKNMFLRQDKMNKQLIIIVVAILLVVVGLSGCIDTSFTKSENEGMML